MPLTGGIRYLDLENKMWKLIIVFIVFAAGAVFILSKGGDVDIGGEKHNVEAPQSTADAASAPSGGASATKP